MSIKEKEDLILKAINTKEGKEKLSRLMSNEIYNNIRSNREFNRIIFHIEGGLSLFENNSNAFKLDYTVKELNNLIKYVNNLPEDIYEEYKKTCISRIENLIKSIKDQQNG